MRCMLLAAVVLATMVQSWETGAWPSDPQLFVRNKYIVEVSGDAGTLAKRGLTPDKVSHCDQLP